MIKGVLLRALMATALVISVPGTTIAQDDDPAPTSLDALAPRFLAQQEQIERLHQRLDSVRIGTIRERIKALENAVDGLSGAFAASTFSLVVGHHPAAQPTLAQESTE